VFSSLHPLVNFEMIYVNDGSTDHTAFKIKQLASTKKNVGFIDFSRNFGKEAAMLAGLEAASGDAIIIMDADLQHPPELIGKMVIEWLSGNYDTVYAKRKDRKGEPILRSWFSMQFYKLINKMGDIQIVNGASDFRLMDRKVVDNILRLKERNRFSKGLFEWVGFRSKCIEYSNIERNAGSTSWNFMKLVRYAIDGIVAFSTAPLQWATILGFLTATTAFLYMVYVIISTLIFGISVNGYASTVSFLLFFGGIQLIFLGIIGEYIGRIFIEVKARPHYIIKEQIMSAYQESKENHRELSRI
jgi:glycosyltransferase involved in cell wall biosynthesis